MLCNDLYQYNLSSYNSKYGCSGLNYSAGKYGCYGAINNSCYPACIWPDNASHYYYLRKDAFLLMNDINTNYAISARCVLDSIVEEQENKEEAPIPTKEFCKSINAIFIDKAYSGNPQGGICVTKYNVGDNVGYGGPEIPSSVKIIDVETVCPDVGNCCRQGHTADTGNELCSNTGNGEGYSYSGCQRTVCQRGPSNMACKEYAPSNMNKGYWRLPKKDELSARAKYLNIISANQGVEGIMLCDDKSSQLGSVRCRARNGGCPKSQDNYCGPNAIWTETLVNSAAILTIILSQES